MIVALIPVKRLAAAKSRLAAHVTPAARKSLVLTMLTRTVSAVRESPMIGLVAVTTAEENLALEPGVEVLPDAGDLNRSLRSSVVWAQEKGASAVLILPADLPLIRCADVDQLLQAATGPPSITIVSTQDGGTGALLLSPPDVISPAFGEGSFEGHLEQAITLDVGISLPAIPALSFDLDTAQDLHDLALLTGARNK